MKYSARVKRLLPLLLPLCAGCATLLSLLSYLLVYEAPKTNYFANGSPLPVLAVIFALGCSASGIGLTFPMPKRSAEEPLPGKQFAALPAAIGCFIGAAVLFLSVSSRPALIATLLLLVSGLYHLAVMLLPARYHTPTALLGFAPVIACILVNAVYYFDTSLEMNAPLKLMVLVGLLSAMIYHTGEIRYLLGRAMPRTFFVYGAFLLGIGSLSALPVPVAFLLGKFARSTTAANAPFLSKTLYHPEYLAGAVVLLGVMITASLRLYNLWKQLQAEPATEDAEIPSIDDMQEEQE